VRKALLLLFGILFLVPTVEAKSPIQIENLGTVPTRIIKIHQYIVPVYPAWMGCETVIAVACRYGDTPCIVSINGFRFEINPGMLWKHTFTAEDLMIINQNDFSKDYVVVRDETPDNCSCTYSPWSGGGNNKPCNILAWYKICCLDTMTVCDSPRRGFE